MIPGLGRSLGGGSGNPLQYSCLENLMDRGAWRATVQSAAKSRTRLSDWACMHARILLALKFHLHFRYLKYKISIYQLFLLKFMQFALCWYENSWWKKSRLLFINISLTMMDFWLISIPTVPTLLQYNICNSLSRYNTVEVAFHLSSWHRLHKNISLTEWMTSWMDEQINFLIFHHNHR